MSDIFKNVRADTSFGSGTPESQREAAVAAALTLIHAKVGNSPDKTETLNRELANLSSYADTIQAALIVK